MTETHTPPDDPLLFRFFNEVGIIEQLSRSAFERVLPDGLKISQFSVLNHFARLGGERSPAALARAFQVTKGAMTNTLQRLEARGLVTVRPDPRDGRGKLVTITPEGRRVRDRCIAATVPMAADLRARFGDAAFGDALPFLAEVRSYLDAARDAPEADP